jgi:hypothetical protein
VFVHMQFIDDVFIDVYTPTNDVKNEFKDYELIQMSRSVGMFLTG